MTKPDLMAELAEAVQLVEAAHLPEVESLKAHVTAPDGDAIATCYSNVAHGIEEYDVAEAFAAAVNFLRTHHAELEAVVRRAAKWDAVASIVEMADTESAGQVTTACGLVLIDRAATVNAGKLELRFDGVTGDDGVEFGDWIVTVKKAAMHNSAREG